MDLILKVCFEDHGTAGYVASIDSIKGLVVSGKTFEDTCKELIISVKVKLAHDLGIPAVNIKEVTEQEMLKIKRKLTFQNNNSCKKEISLSDLIAA